MIRLENISLTFNEGEAAEVKALQNINLHVKDQDYLVVIGANGSGKSSLLNVLAGNLKPVGGKIEINNENISNWKDYRRSKLISRIFQNPLQGTASELSILDNFRLASIRTQSKKLKVATTEEFIDRVRSKISLLHMGLEDKLIKPMGSLSGGQRQALTLVMAIMDDCKVMLLDEPTAALDPKSATLVMEKATEIITSNKITAILVTHNLKDALKYGNRMILMQEGKILKDFKTEEKSAFQADQLFKLF
jgi:putative tryptophan/tyrosine transport system ATP-binding protein